MAGPNAFLRFASKAAHLAGRPLAFGLACLVILVWALTGPILHFSNVWQLTVNTGTTIITFLMVFLLQNTQNRDAKALQVKLDELIRVTKEANDALLDLEELSEEDIELFRKYYERLAERARQLGLPSPSGIEAIAAEKDRALTAVRNEAAPRPARQDDELAG